jgi:aspartyl-tRNA(Asn)/glutamyl-tRNA(Gln) amidotransferase subunit A
VQLVTSCLDRIREVEPYVHAWRQLDAERALATARERDHELSSNFTRGALHGIPVAIKDIIDVEGLPTRCNSVSRANAAVATADAEIVRALKAQGAVVLGKVHTTEFAFFDPSPARNPHNIAHTPGGSSSGSAAAVAAGMVPFSVGTQTVASVNRPAAYCGIAAFKPTTKSLSIYGIAPLGPGYDTPGFFGWSVADAIYAYQAIAPPWMAEVPSVRGKIAILDDPHIRDASGESMLAVERLRDRFTNSGATVETRKSPIDFARLDLIQRSTMLFEASRAMSHFLRLAEGQIGEKLRGAIVEGCKISEVQYLDERREIDRLRAVLLEATSDIDAYLWPATPTTAPLGLGWTGEPKYIAPWTAIGGPMLTVPSGFSTNGLPLGCIVCGKPEADRALMQLARRHLI